MDQKDTSVRIIEEGLKNIHDTPFKGLGSATPEYKYNAVRQKQGTCILKPVWKRQRGLFFLKKVNVTHQRHVENL